MNLIKSSLWTSVSTVIKLASGFIINKIIAIHIGASGLAVIGQFRDFLIIVMTFSNGGIQQGVVKYTAEYKDDEEKLSRLLSTSLIINILCSFLVGLTLLFLHNYLSVKIFKTSDYGNILLVLSFTVILFALNSFFISLLNGFKELRKFVFASITSSLIGLVVTSILIIFYQLKGALLALAINQSIIIFGTLFFIKSSDWFRIRNFKKGLDKKIIVQLSSYSLMFITSALTMPVALLLVRNYIGENLSWEDAGYWEGIWRLSEMYLMFLTSSFGVYLLPTFSSLQGDNLKKEIFKAWKFVIPVSIFIASIIFILKDWLILLLFSDEFYPMSQLFFFQLLGDIVKVSSWILGIVIIAKAKTKEFIGIQIGWCILFVLLAKFFLNNYELVGVTIAYFLSYVIHFIFLIFYYKQLLWGKRF